MLSSRRALFAGLSFVFLLSGCAQLTAGQQPAPPPPAAAVQSMPTITPTPSPAPPATPTPSLLLGADRMSAGTVAPGEVMFVRGGQLWAIGVDGGNERAITGFYESFVLRDLALSLNGRYLAFTVNSSILAVLDTYEGSIIVRERANSGLIRALVWSRDSLSLYYEKLTPDPSTVLPATSQVMQVTVNDLTPPQNVVSGDATVELTPSFSLGGSSLLLTETHLDVGQPTVPLIFAPGGGLTPLAVPDLQSPGVADVSPDGAHLLLYDQAKTSADGPTALYAAGYDPAAGAQNVRPIAADDTASFGAAFFAPDSQRIVVLMSAQVNGVPGPATAVVFTPAGDTFSATPLAAVPDMTALAASWHGDDGVIVQWLPLAGGDSTLWRLPLDGAPGTQLTTGEMPVVALAQR